MALNDETSGSLKGEVPVEPTGSSRSSSSYIKALDERFWRYVEAKGSVLRGALDPERAYGTGAPVLSRGNERLNLLLPEDRPELADRICRAVPRTEWHRWYRSMRSSQALAQSVFGALAATDRVDALAGLMAEDGQIAFFDSASGISLELEHSVGGGVPGRGVEAEQ